MRSILLSIILLTLNSCETTKQMKFNEKNKKQKKIMMDITTKPNIKIKKSEINFEDVSFKYLANNEKAINNINLKIEGGTMAALVGHSGAGKSTILNLLP